MIYIEYFKLNWDKQKLQKSMQQINIEITKTIDFLKKGKSILYPTDTVWGIGCDATDEDAVKNIYKIKKRNASKSLIILVDSIEMLEVIIKEIPKKVIRILNKSSKPTTIIYKNPVGIAPNCIAEDNTVAIRIVRDNFCQKLINQFKKPIVSTSANISGSKTPHNFGEIDVEIKKQVDYIVLLKEHEQMNKASRIISLINDEITIIRE